MAFESVTLEVSLKPFRDLSEKGIRRICENMYRQWQSLLKDADSVSVLFWSSDGSEILEYRGNPDDSFEWAKYIGVANPEVFGKAEDLPSERLSVHRAPRLYTSEPLKITYRDLMVILKTMRLVFGEKDKKIRVGTAFDPGPEFAVSVFKYKRHREICMAETLGSKSFVCCYSGLNSDSGVYAGFPEGIEQDTPFGRFLGRQARLFCSDIGFDYIWFSNGFGFGCETWGACGAVFDGVTFQHSKCPDIKEKILEFWREFRKEAPCLPVETRGTNLSTGMDLSSDAVPLREIYRTIPPIVPPPNSPWAAINGDFGMELAGWMSHIAEIPAGGGYPYRLYIHDPWFINSPWLDRYGRNPHDIYLPLAVCRIDEKGSVTNPCRISFLTVDDSMGEMPEQVPEEVIPHVKDAMRTAPDEAGPVIWLYPFDEYHEMTFNGGSLEEVFFGDWYMRSAINSGFQVNTVVSTGNFQAALSQDKCFKKIIVTPTATASNKTVFELLKTFIFQGGQVLLYGPVDSEGLFGLLGLNAASPVSGELEIKTGSGSFRSIHNPIYSAGSINTVPEKNSEIRIVASVVKGNEERIFSSINARDSWNGGRVAWVRGSNSLSIKKNGKWPQMLDRSEFFYPETLMRVLLGELGYACEFKKYSSDKPDPVLVTNYCRNALYLSAYIPDTATVVKLKYPEGAPIFTGTEVVIEEGTAAYNMPRAPHFECRVFVEMNEGHVSCIEKTRDVPEIERRIELRGLKNATVRFRPVPGKEGVVRMLYSPASPPFVKGEFLKTYRNDKFPGIVLECRDVTGDIMILWPVGKNQQIES